MTKEELGAAIHKIYDRFKIEEYLFQIETHRNKQNLFLSLQKVIAILTFLQSVSLVFYALIPESLEMVWMPIITILVINGFSLSFNISGRACMHATWAAEYETLLRMRIEDESRTMKTINPE